LGLALAVVAGLVLSLPGAAAAAPKPAHTPAASASSAEAERVERRRPTDGGRGGFQTSNLAAAATDHFCYTWANDGTDAIGLADAGANGIPDYIDALAYAAEFSYAIEHGVLEWPTPKPDKRGCGPNGGVGRTDIYLLDVGPRLYGYASVDPDQKGRRQAGYLVLDNDYAFKEFGYRDPLQALSVTVAHEYNHVVQFGIDVIADRWLKEATGTWMEEQVFPAVNDFLGYLPRFTRSTEVPLTDPGPKVYGDVVWNHWLTSRYGPDVIRDTYRVSGAGTSFAAAAYNQVITRESGRRSDFLREFTAFSTAVAEWRAGDDFPDAELYPDVERAGVLPIGGSERRLRLDHTTFRLLSVPAVSRPAVRLEVQVQLGTRAAVALVGRDGGATTGKVTRVLRVLPNGGRATIALRNPGRFERITAVLVNGDIRASGFGGGDWLYTGDDRLFSVRVAAGTP
jgi:hypothetical protein